MNDLITINMNGQILEYFDATRCVEHYYFHTKGLRHIKSTCNQSDVAAKSKDGWWT
jgi:hypothetical protein